MSRWLRHGCKRCSMSPEPDWRLDAACVDVWSLSFDDAAVSAAASVLIAAELEQASRMRAGEVRDSFIKARAALRCLLARYLDISPLQVPLTWNQHGKPMLSAEASLRFNLTHTRGLAMYAVAFEREVGIDAEWMDAAVDWRAVAPTVFSAHEVATLMRTPEPQQRPAFFTAWTRKEALLKGMGTGFGTSEDPQDADAWTLLELGVGAEYKAALAVHGEGTSFQHVQRRLDADLLVRLQRP